MAASPRTTTIERVGVVHLDGPFQIELNVAKEIVQRVEQAHIDFDALADAGIGETLCNLERSPILGVDELLAEHAAAKESVRCQTLLERRTRRNAGQA